VSEESATYEVQSVALSDSSQALATLQDLEEASYQLVRELGDAEWKLILILAAIRDSGMWQQSHERFDEYLRDWSIEASARLPNGRGMPVAIRVLQAKLALHRRLVEWGGMDAQQVLSQPYYVMDKLCRALGKWDYKSGEPVLTEQARAKLIENYGDEADDRTLIQSAVKAVSGIAIPGDAMQFIGDTFGPTIQDQTIYDLVLEVWKEIPQLRCHVQQYDLSGLVVEDYWCGPDYPWPEGAIAHLARLIGVKPVDRG
jgi:hypothetical protein